MATNPGKKFENDFKNSVDIDKIFLHRIGSDIFSI